MELEGEGKKEWREESGVRVPLKDESGQRQTGQRGDQAGREREGPKSGEG